MTVTLNNAARTAAVDAITALFDVGANGVLRIYNGTRPAGPATAVSTQTLLAEFGLDADAFPGATNGVASLDVSPALTDDGLAAGTATWCRFVDGAGTNNGVMDGKVTATGGGGDIELNSTTVSVGVAVEITGGTLTMPAGTAD